MRDWMPVHLDFIKERLNIDMTAGEIGHMFNVPSQEIWQVAFSMRLERNPRSSPSSFYSPHKPSDRRIGENVQMASQKNLYEPKRTFYTFTLAVMAGKRTG